MITDISVVFFDLFYTLVNPKYNNLRNENDVLGVSIFDWEKYAEDSELYNERASGKVNNAQRIIEAILDKMKVEVNDYYIKEILELRVERFKKSFVNIDFKILDVLCSIKKNGKKLCLISNTDIIDVMYWEESPLSKLFDEVIFSYKVGYLKPNLEIYRIAMKKMNVNSKNCVFIGDGGSDELKGAKALGMKTILTSYLLNREKKLNDSTKEFADYCIDDFKEIEKILFL